MLRASLLLLLLDRAAERLGVGGLPLDGALLLLRLLEYLVDIGLQLDELLGL